MSVFRQRRVFRDFGDTQPIGSASVVTGALVTGIIAFAGTALGATTSSSGGSVSGAIAFGGGSITEASLEVSASGPVVLSGASVTGLSISTRNASGSVVFAGAARPAALASGAIAFGGSATVGTTFTMDASGAIVMAGTVAGRFVAPSTTGQIRFGGTVETPDVTDGTVEADARPAEITFAGTATGASVNIVQGTIEFGGLATGQQLNSTKPIDRAVINVDAIYEGYITVEVSGE